MSLRDLQGKLKYSYSTARDNILEELYKPCLSESRHYYRGAGYFRSSVFSLMTEEIANFCTKGGKIHLLTATTLTREDYESAIEGYSLRDFNLVLEEMLLDPRSSLPTRFLCSLIASNHMDIHIAKVPEGGIYHDKTGFFRDQEGDVVAFHGSGNETLPGVIGRGGNIETYDVIWGWDDAFHIHGENWVSGLESAIDHHSYEGAKILPRQG